MNKSVRENEFDVIVVGSGACGATIARELSKNGKKILILEQGSNTAVKESFFGVAPVADEMTIGDKMKTIRAVTTGGSTSLYFGVADLPPLNSFLKLGIDLSKELDEVQKEVPSAPLPDVLISEQSIRVRNSAEALGHTWQKNPMFLNPSLRTSGHGYEAKWRARSFVEEAVRSGATLINRAKVRKVLIEKNQAIGVEYALAKGFKGAEIRRAYATKIVVAAGAMSSPMILRRSGLKNIGQQGFFCDPSFLVMGFVPDLKGKDLIVGSFRADRYEDDVMVGDGNLSRLFYQLTMLGEKKLSRFFSFSSCVGVGVKMKDSLGGEILDSGRYNRQLTQEELKKLDKGKESAIKILEHAGAKNIIQSSINATPGGMIRIQEQLDETLQTECRNLYVCDSSVMPEKDRVPPSQTLICLGKYLSKHLLQTL